MKKLLTVLLSVLMIVSLFTACAPAAEPAQESPAAPAQEATEAPAEAAEEPADDAEEAPAEGSAIIAEGDVVKMGLAMNSRQAPAFHAWADYLKQRLEYEAEERGYVLEFTELNADNDVTKQANDIKDLIAQDCDVIFAPALDSQAILQSVEEVHEAGKIFVSYCREVSPDATGAQVPDLTVNFSSEEQAYVGVIEMFKIMEADGVTPTKMIDVYGDTTDENAHNREDGMRRALEDAGYADIEVITVDCGRWEPDVAMANLAPVLAAHPDANCMYTSSDFLLSGIQTAMENADMWHPRGEEGHVYIAGSDLFAVGIDALVSKHMDTGVDQGCYNFAVQAAAGAFDLLEGKAVEPYQLVLGTVATNDTIEEILATIPLWGNDYR